MPTSPVAARRRIPRRCWPLLALTAVFAGVMPPAAQALTPAAGLTATVGPVGTTPGTPAGTATIGDERDVTLDVELPGGAELFDVTVLDTLPDGLRYRGLQSVTCLEDCDDTALSATELTRADDADGTTGIGFFLGDVAASPGGAPRTVRIVYRAAVDDVAASGPVVRGATLANAAAAFSDRTDKLPAGQTARPPVAGFDDTTGARTATLTVTEPTVTLDKRVSGQVADGDVRASQPGGTFTYTIAVKNTGDATAHDVAVTDLPDAELTDIVLAGGASSTANVDGWSAGDPDLAWSIPSIAVGATVTLVYVADLELSSALRESDQAINVAGVTEYFAAPRATRTAEPGLPHRRYTDTPPDIVTVDVDLPRLTVANTTGGILLPESAHAEVGLPFAWQVTVANTSPTATATGIDVTYRLPPNWSYDDGSASFGGPPTITPDPVDGDLLTWEGVTDLAPGTSQVIAFTATPSLAAATTPGGGDAHPNVTSASVTGADVTGAPGSAAGAYAAGPDLAQAILNAPALTLATTPDAGVVSAGTTATWTIAVANTGLGVAHAVRVTDTLPRGVTYAAGTATSADAGFSELSRTVDADGTTTVVWTLGDLATATTASISVPVAVSARDDAGTTYVDRAAVVATEQPAGVSDSGSFTVQTRAGVSVVKAATTPRFVAGGDAAWSLVVGNAGPSEARGVTLTDPLPAGVTLVGVDAGGGDCTVTGRVVTCAEGTLAPGAERTVEVRGTLAAGATGSVENTAAVTTTTTDPDAGDDRDTATTPVDARADLRLTKRASAATVVQGGTVTYTVEVRNRGASDARDVVVTDPLATGLRYVSDDSGCTTPGGVVTCDLGTVAAGASRTVAVVARVDRVGELTNTATVVTPTPDADPADDTDTATVAVTPAVDLALDLSGPATVGAGQDATFTLAVTNAGPSASTGSVITDTLPPGLVFASSPDCVPSVGSTLTCTVPALAPGATFSASVVVTAAYAAAETSVVDRATVVNGPDESDVDDTDDTDTATVAIGPAADLRLAQTVTPAVALAQNREAVFRLTVTNDGPSTAQAPVITDALPASLAFVSATAPCTQAAGTVTCTLPALPSGASSTVTVTVRGRENGVSTNTASVASATPDPDPDNNRASVSLAVGPTADLSITATAPPTVAAGGELRYTLAVTDAGPSPGTGVVVRDTLPAGLDFVSATPAQGICTAAGATVTCALGELAVGGRTTIVLKATATFATAGKRVVNRASVESAENDNDASDDSAEAAVTVGPAADLELVQRAPETVAAGGRLRATLRVVNHGPQEATGVTVTDVLPAGLTLASARPSDGRCSAAGARVACLLGTIPVGGAAEVLLVTDVAASLEGSRVVNVASVAGGEPDPSPADNTDDAATAVGPPAPTGVLTVSKVADGTRATLGEPVGFTITVRNGANRPATGVVAVDTPSAPVDVVSVRPSQGGCRVLHCLLGTLAPGAQATIRVVLAPRRLGRLVNRATASADGGVAQPADDGGLAAVQVSARSTRFTLEKRVSSVRAKAPGVADFVLTATNVGAAAAADVLVCDVPDGHLTFLRATGAWQHAGRACWTVAYWRAGATRTFTVRMRVARGAREQAVNRAVLTAANAPRRTAEATLPAG